MPFPHRYSVDSSDDRLTAEPRQPIEVGAPPQFGGTNEVWSPEELLVGAVLSRAIHVPLDVVARIRERA